MNPFSVALMIYADNDSGRNALTEEKYKDLGAAFLAAGYTVKSILYNDQVKVGLYNRLIEFDAVLVWVNPIEQGKDRKELDSLLRKVAEAGCMVSAHPDVILKIGTKDVLYKTREMSWSGETNLYSIYEEFVERFPASLAKAGIKVLKQYRGNGGNGVFKIENKSSNNEVIVTHANKGYEAMNYSWNEFNEAFRSYFFDDGLLIEQEWNSNHANGMVRCYLCGNKVAGFGYQEINALYENTLGETKIQHPPSKRYYFTENCGLFADLKQIMETLWVPQMQESQAISNDMLPVIWDADFFINNLNSISEIGKYSLCEINVSSVSPFPTSATKYIVEEVGTRIRDYSRSKIKLT